MRYYIRRERKFDDGIRKIDLERETGCGPFLSFETAGEAAKYAEERHKLPYTLEPHEYARPAYEIRPYIRLDPPLRAMVKKEQGYG